MEHRWNDTDRGKPKYSGKNLSQCHFFHHLHGERPATNRLSYGTASALYSSRKFMIHKKINVHNSCCIWHKYEVVPPSKILNETHVTYDAKLLGENRNTVRKNAEVVAAACK
jgi:hypothetical protein